MQSAGLRSLGVAIVLCAGCSFIGARVPDKPPPPPECPTGVIAADILGLGFAALPLTLVTIDVLDPNRRASDGDIGLVVIIPALAILTIAYGSSTIYGVHERGRCLRMQREALDAQTASDAQRTRAHARPDIIGIRPLHCVIAPDDIGHCSFDETACTEEAARTAGTCEPRTTGWCFDAQGIVDRAAETICAPSQNECDARRAQSASDRSRTVTGCGRYSVPAANPPAANPPTTNPPAANLPATNPPVANPPATNPPAATPAP